MIDAGDAPLGSKVGRDRLCGFLETQAGGAVGGRRWGIWGVQGGGGRGITWRAPDRAMPAAAVTAAAAVTVATAVAVAAPPTAAAEVALTAAEWAAPSDAHYGNKPAEPKVAAARRGSRPARTTPLCSRVSSGRGRRGDAPHPAPHGSPFIGLQSHLSLLAPTLHPPSLPLSCSSPPPLRLRS